MDRTPKTFKFLGTNLPIPTNKVVVRLDESEKSPVKNANLLPEKRRPWKNGGVVFTTTNKHADKIAQVVAKHKFW